MHLLHKINKRYYSYFDKETAMLFTFKENNRGINGIGKDWCLSITYAGTWDAIATFCTQDDGRYIYKEDYKGILWDPYDAFIEADAMVCKMVGK